MLRTSVIFLFLLGLLSCRISYADIVEFGSGDNRFTMSFVEIGNPGNLPDETGVPNPAGSVAYHYSIGFHEVSRNMITKANAASGLGIIMHPADFGASGARPEMPATGISWLDAAKFVNYLNQSKGFSSAYKFNESGDYEFWQPGDMGCDESNPLRNSLAAYVLPTSDEWYKAAYYDSVGVYYDFSIGSDIAPVSVVSGTSVGTAVYNHDYFTGPADAHLAGGLSPYGTIGQGGNVMEWEETIFGNTFTPNSPRGFRGGRWTDNAPVLSSSSRLGVRPDHDGLAAGFRVVRLTAVPEPSILISLSFVSMFMFLGMRRRRHC